MINILHSAYFHVAIMIDTILKFFIHFNPKCGFLSDVVALEAAILAILIPLSTEIISKISERYQSEVVIRLFEKETINKLLPWFLVINVVLAVSLRFLALDELNGLAWKVLSWVTYSICIIVSISILIFYRCLKRYISDFEFILGRLFSDAEKIVGR